MSNTRDTQLCAGWVNWLAGAVAFGLYVGTEHVGWLWLMVFAGGLGSILLILALREPKQEIQPSPPKEPTPSFPASFFMPFCVCPKCKVEALHWMEETPESPGFCAWLDILRTCRECGHTWGQNVGLKNGG